MKSTKKLWQKILPSVVALIVVIAFFVMFMINSNKRVALQNGSYLLDTAEKTSSRIADDLYSAAATLGEISEVCHSDEINAYPKELTILGGSVFSRIDYISVDEGIADNGNTYYNGTLYGFSGERSPEPEPDIVISVSSNPDASTYYQPFALGVQAKAGQAEICSEQSLAGVQFDGLSFYAALRDEAGKLLGVLVGRMDHNRLKKVLQSTFFGEYTGVYLINGAGDLVGSTDDQMSASGKKLNIYEVLREYLPNSDVEDVSQSLSQGNILSFSFQSSSGTVDACIMQFSAEQGLGADGWIILQTFPSTVTASLLRLVKLEGLQLGLGLFFALALYFGIILLVSVQNKKLAQANREMAFVVEGLANLYDRFVYVNLNENRYQFIANTFTSSDGVPAQGDYDIFKNYIISTFKDSYDVTHLAKRLDMEQIKADMSDGTSQLRYEYRTGDGSHWDDLNIICLSRINGEVSEVLFARQNISELKEMELKNQALLKEAFHTVEDANRAMSDFLSSMSHDIRTPMNAVLGFSELIEKSAYNPAKVTEYTQKMQVAGHHLLGLVNDILDIGRIERGKLSLNVAEFSMSSLIDGISAVISPQVRQKNQICSIRREGVLNDAYFGDSLRISQVLINVLSNAVKYTPVGGKIDFTIRARSNGIGDRHNLQFIVKDNGIGMSEQFIKRMYQPFEREKTPLASRVQGTGLGMSITKTLVDLMGGAIDVKSQVGVGTTVTVTLRLAVPVGANALPAQQNAQAGSIEGMTFLVAEDNQLNAEILCEFLAMAGAKYEIAKNGSEAFRMFEQNAGKYDVILMDVQMPVMDGYDAARAIRSSSNPFAKTIPIIAMTASVFAEDIQRSLASGMNSHVAKPVSIEVLTAAVADLKNNSV